MRSVSKQHVLALLVATLLVAAALRLPDLTQVPPGPHYDEAANGVLAGDIGLRGQRPVFISSYTGKEVLFFYLAGGLMRLLGESVFTLRLTAAFVGLLTIAATYWLGREMALDRQTVLIAVILLAVSFWHLVFSRLGFRAITQPLLQALLLAALLRGVRGGQRRWLVMAGVFLGLTGYTYLAARLFPLLLLLACWPLLVDRARLPLRARQLLQVVVIGAAVLTPLASYFWAHPDAFWVRISQVGSENVALPLGESVMRSLEMFFLVGDPYLRFNIPERPLFNPFWGTLLLVGWGYSLTLLRRVRQDWQRSVLLLLLLNPIIMLLPTALATSEIVPSNLRAIGLIPLIFYLPAIGLMVLLRSIESWLQSRMVTVAALAISLTLLLLGGILTERLYFRAWASDPALFDESDGDLAQVAAYLDQADLAGKRVYVAARHYQHPTVAFLSAAYERVAWLPNSEALVLPASGPALYVYPRTSPMPDWVRPYLGGDAALALLETAPGDAFTAVEMTTFPPLTIPHPMALNFGSAVTLLGYSVGAARTGDALPLTLFWRIDAPPAADLSLFVHLEDLWGHRWSQAEPDAYPAPQWQPGETVIQRVALPVPVGAPPGPYRLRIGWFEPATGNRLPQLDAAGRYAGDAYLLEHVGVLAGDLPETLPRPPFGVHEQVLPGLRLVGYQLGGTRVATGERLGLALWWEATRPLPPLRTRLELLRADNTGRILIDTQPVHDSYPFAAWYTPQFLIDHVDPQIPAAFPAGDYRLLLRILNEENETLLKRQLGHVRVDVTERVYAPPPLQIRVDALFGREIALLGYDLNQRGDRTFTLRLAWQAAAAPAADYTVFVHVLGLDGVCCVWQQDVMPRQNAYPTTRWLPDEVVEEVYEIQLPADLPPGKYPVEIGLYIAETGQRLQVQTTDATTGDAVYLRPLGVE